MARRVLAVAALVVAVVGCNDDGEDRAGDGPTTTAAPTTTTDPAWSGPGADVLGGLVVPEGAVLLGQPVTVPQVYELDGQPARDPDTQHAYLAVTGDPFVAFDALVDQARALDVDLPGTAGSCFWNVSLDEQVGFRLLPVARPDPVEQVTGARCEAWAQTDDEALRLVLDVDVERPGTLTVSTEAGGAGGATRFGAAEQTRANRRNELADTREAEDLEPATFLDADDPVPAEVSERLPEAAPLSDGDPGDPVLPTVWCRDDRDAGDLTVPDGARVLARPVVDGTYPDQGNVAVLATDDAEATIRDLYDPAAGDVGGFYGDPPAPVELEDGTPVWSVSFGVSAGGDTCSLVASPDGTTILLSVGRG